MGIPGCGVGPRDRPVRCWRDAEAGGSGPGGDRRRGPWLEAPTRPPVPSGAGDRPPPPGSGGQLDLLVGRDQGAEPLDAARELRRRGVAAELDGPRRVEDDVGEAPLGVGVGHVAEGRRGGEAGVRRAQRGGQGRLGGGQVGGEGLVGLRGDPGQERGGLLGVAGPFGVGELRRPAAEQPLERGRVERLDQVLDPREVRSSRLGRVISRSSGP